MSRVGINPMVGNDFVINTISRGATAQRAAKIEYDLVAEAPQVRQIPYRSLGVLAFNSAAIGQPLFVLPTVGEYHSRFFTRMRIMVLVTILVLIGLSAGVVAEKQQILNLGNRAKAYAVQLAQDTRGHKVVSPVVNPRQVTIRSSDLYTAMTALITQQISLSLGGSSQSVNPATIATWINQKTEGSQTVLSVNTGQLSSYLSQITQTGKQENDTTIYSRAAFNQIANNLLKAKGMSVALSDS